MTAVEKLKAFSEALNASLERLDRKWFKSESKRVRKLLSEFKKDITGIKRELIEKDRA